MTETTAKTHPDEPDRPAGSRRSHAPGDMTAVATVALDRPWMWLAAGARDIMRAPIPSLAYGFAITVLSFAITAGVVIAGQVHWMLPLLCGFLLVGPIVAVGLYDISRRLEAGETPTVAASFQAWRINAMQLGLMGAYIGIFFLFWFRIATLLFALFFGDYPFGIEELVGQLTTLDGLAFLATGTAVGAVLAVVIYATSVVSIPMLLDRNVSVVEAILASLTAFTRNPATLLVWAATITALAIAGIATAYVGLAVIMPLLGHASWHAYRDLIRDVHD